jgi:hypothetical protein
VNDAFYVEVGIPNTGSTSLGLVQAVRSRAVGGGVAATLTSTNPAVGQLVTNSLSGPTVTIAIAPGQYHSPSVPAASGGVELDPLSAGTTFVQATAPGFIQTNPGANFQVTVNP